VAGVKSAWALSPVFPTVAARNARPTAVMATPIHSRCVTSWPKARLASTVSSTSPPAITVWTSEIGASDRAATCSPQEPIATAMPSEYAGERNRRSDERSGLRHSTSGDSTAPRAFSRKPSSEATAVASASNRPSWTDSGMHSS
jgi:hypothetical protein